MAPYQKHWKFCLFFPLLRQILLYIYINAQQKRCIRTISFKMQYLGPVMHQHLQFNVPNLYSTCCVRTTFRNAIMCPLVSSTTFSYYYHSALCISLGLELSAATCPFWKQLISNYYKCLNMRQETNVLRLVWSLVRIAIVPEIFDFLHLIGLLSPSLPLLSLRYVYFHPFSRRSWQSVFHLFLDGFISISWWFSTFRSGLSGFELSPFEGFEGLADYGTKELIMRF